MTSALSFTPVVFSLAIITSGCNDPMLLMNDSERAMWESMRVVSHKEASLLRVKHLSRDLEYCSSNDGSYSLSPEDFEILSNRPNEEFSNKLFQLIPSCKPITNYLLENIDQARQSGNSRKNIYRALVEGQADIR
ncbi:hypothetical protein IQ265_04415 [Nodosilinea sp. LEGE 06152]|uniref:hypothetical protein n=1 Tax=Nodosilinea sp. LEGE 06152 TaxID=2777966 RepID=UPI00187ED629|nr:hypothetical protein [Nodosilinea sp. LEGE 06152]MBE9156079.1 hypothetical protein [Nodosilinea sp. LEGE 06152]